MLKQDKIINHKVNNLVQTVLLFGGMLLLLALIGSAIAGTTGLWWATILGLLFLLFGQQISPQWVLRAQRARPLMPYEAPALHQLVQALAQRAKLITAPRLYYIPQEMPNAFTVGSGQEAGLGITAGLLQRLDQRELTAVLAHEISHIQHNDMRVLAFAGLVTRLTGLFSGLGQFLLFINLPLLLMGRATISWLAILLMIAAPTLSGLLHLALSRTREFEADIGAVKLTGDPIGLASALRKLEQSQASWLKMLVPGYRLPESAVLRTHPNTKERIERLLALTDAPLPAPGSQRWPGWHFTA
jgi:heat shock protein HtpX